MQESWLRGHDPRWRDRRLRFLPAIFVALLSLSAFAQTQPQHPAANGKLDDILNYIQTGWDSLTRSTSSCRGIPDTKVAAAPVIYIPASFPVPPELEKMEHDCKVTVKHLPSVIHELGTVDMNAVHPAGLLYLPNQYVVPGGRFNEMYGWDSYFIVLGLLRDGRMKLARDMVDNFFFEIEHYGAVLNANRTYYLTRSQPPFLSSMVMAVHESQKAAGEDDRAWLEKSYEYLKRDHDMWTRAPHLAGNTGLSRYYDFGDGPALEALQDENDIYRQVAAYFLLHPGVPAYAVEDSQLSSDKALGATYTIRLCGNNEGSSCETAGNIRLTPDYYKGDRSMRESGFDISFRFGPYGAATHHFAPVCLNSLLFKTELDLEQISQTLGKNTDAAQWRKAADARKQAIQKYLWDPQLGMFFDYNFDTGQRSTYRYATTFYPLWAGLATEAEARAVTRNLALFEQPGGIVMSLQRSKGQWDYPYGWAPMQLISVEGMRRYGYNAQADQVSTSFLSMVLQNFERDGTIREKYDVVTRSSDIKVTAGYAANVTGFGWTNGTFLELLHSLPPGKVDLVSKKVSSATASR